MPASGQLNSRIDIIKATDSTGVGEPTTTYSVEHENIPAMREDVSGGQTRRGHQVEATVRAVFTIPRIAGISPHWRVQLKDGTGSGPTYEIISVLERDDRRVWVELHCGDVR